MDKQQEYVLRTLEERDIRFARLWFTDVLGFLKSVAVAPAELEGAFAEGIGFDGSAIEGFARVYESDMLAKPDPSTFQVLPWRSEAPGAARMFCDILLPDGTPSYADPRYVLKRALTKAKDLGFTFYTHPEIEFYLFEGRPAAGEAPVPIDSSGYFDHTPHALGQDFRRQAITMLESMGISVEFSHHEGGPGQNEIDLRYADALSTADNIMTFRLVMKQVALEQGVYASFMPKPFAEPPRLRDAHAPQPLRGRPQRLLRGGRAVPALQGRARLHRRAAAARTGDHRRHQPVGELLQAALRRWRGTGLRLLGPQQQVRHGASPHVQSRARVSPPASRSAAWTRRATPTWLTRCCWRPASGASSRSTSSRSVPRTTSGR